MRSSLAGIITIVGFTLAVIALPARCETATWYDEGASTANGEAFDPDGFCADYPLHSCTCAHRSFAFGTWLKVTRDRRVVVCRVNDRGPAVSTGADIDLSRSGAYRLGMLVAGRVTVRIDVVRRME